MAGLMAQACGEVLSHQRFGPPLEQWWPLDRLTQQQSRGSGALEPAASILMVRHVLCTYWVSRGLEEKARGRRGEEVEV